MHEDYRRHDISDDLWIVIEPNEYFGFYERAHRGGICPRDMVIGMLHNVVFADGGIRAFGKISFSLS